MRGWAGHGRRRSMVANCGEISSSYDGFALCFGAAPGSMAESRVICELFFLPLYVVIINKPTGSSPTPTQSCHVMPGVSVVSAVSERAGALGGLRLQPPQFTPNAARPDKGETGRQSQGCQGPASERLRAPLPR